MERKPLYLGTAPFCNAKPEDCEKIPGYRYAGKKGKYISGRRCVTGEKVKCEFNEDEFKSSDVYKRISNDEDELNENYNPDMKWYGRAPVCGGWECDAYEDDKLPVKRSKFGEGSNCISGYKILGVNPLNEKQKMTIERAKVKCKEIRNKTKSKKWKVIADLAANIAKIFTEGGEAPNMKLSSEAGAEVEALMKEILVISRPYMEETWK